MPFVAQDAAAHMTRRALRADHLKHETEAQNPLLRFTNEA